MVNSGFTNEFHELAKQIRQITSHETGKVVFQVGEVLTMTYKKGLVALLFSEF